MIKFRWFAPLTDDRTYLYDVAMERYTIKRHNMVDWYSMRKEVFDDHVTNGNYIILEADGNKEN